MRGITTLHSLGAAIRGERERAGLTQKALAERAGLSRATIIALESGAPFDAATLVAAVRALDLEIAIEPRHERRSESLSAILDETEEL